MTGRVEGTPSDIAGAETAAAPPVSAEAGVGSQNAPARKRHRRSLGTGLIALAALVIMALAWDLTAVEHHVAHQVPASEVSTLISQAIQSELGKAAPPEVTCPAVPARVGATARCSAVVDGRTVPLIVTNEDGVQRFAWHFVGNI
jgi:hypothetical protein